MDINQASLQMHYDLHGKIEVISRKKIETREDLSLAYTPGVAEPCRVIAKDYEQSFKLTRRGNLVAVITDGTAVLGLGDIGPSAGMPVMEGKCALFKAFAGIDAVPICINSKDPDEIVNTVYLISKSFGGINLEDISAPRCFEIEKRLIEMCDIPVFHDDQHGTAIIASAGILNALKVTGKKVGNLKIVISGAGSAGISIAKMFLRFQFGDIILCDREGAIYEGAPFNNPEQEKMAKITNKQHLSGSLADVLKDADILIGVSKPGIVTQDMIRSMAKDPIVFVMANPVPEIMPDVAKAAGARVVGTGRSDFPNQVNNVVAFPGIFKGALEGRATQITEDMKLAAALAIASLVSDDELSDDNIMPQAFDPRVAEVVANAVKSHI